MEKIIFAITLLFLPLAALATHDPNSCATIFIHGFNPEGHSHEGVFGEDEWDEDMSAFPEIAGLPHIGQPGGIDQPNVVASTRYYGDTPPGYYSEEDIAELAAVTAQWGGGVPRYALIMGKYIRHVMDRCGAEQVNLFSGSYGSFVARWIIEKDVEGLAGEGLIARWLSAEGVLSGHWAASNDVMLWLWDEFSTPSLDVDQLHYDWVEANVHSPRTEAGNPFYGDILIGMLGTCDDSAGDGYMTDAMLLLDEFQPNDGIVGLHDSYFHSSTPESRFLGLEPMFGYYYRNHYNLAEYPGTWAQVTNFLTGRKRVSVTMTRAQVNEIHEPDEWWWDFTPAEIIFESNVYSPANEAEYGIADCICERDFDGASTPIYEFGENGQTQYMDHLIFDDMVPDSETELDIYFYAMEIDWEERYDMYEVIGAGDPTDGMEGGWITVPVTGPGTYTFIAPEWNCDLQVEVFDYPFPELATSVPDNSGAPQARLLSLYPNPFSSEVTIVMPGSSRDGGVKRLTIHDARGREVFRHDGARSASFKWDGRDREGGALPNGLYFHRIEEAGRVWTGKSLLLR